MKINKSLTILSLCLLMASTIASARENIALNKVATAPSGATADGSSPGNAIDGDETTYWQSTAAFKKQLFIDLGDRYDVSQIVLKWDGVYYATSIDILYSDLPITSENVDNVPKLSYSNYNSPGTDPVTDMFEDGKKVGLTDLNFTAFTARYVGIQTRGRNGNNGGDHYRVTELEIFGIKNEDGYQPPILDPDKQAAINEIADRLVDKALKGYSNDVTPTNYFNSMLSDGSWTDINYDDKISGDGWVPGTHLTRLGTMAVAFRTPTSTWFENAEMQANIELGLVYYKTKNPRASDNWWYYDISDPQKYMVPSLLLKGYSTYSDIMNIAEYLRDGTTNAAHQGQNLAWISEIVTYKGVIENNFDLTMKSFDKMASILKIVANQGDEGIKIDGSFHQHHEQLYSGGYGLSVTNYLSASMELAFGTLFAQAYTPGKIEIFRNMLLEGHRFLGYRSVMDFGTIGRNIARDGAGDNISSEVLDRMIVADPDKKDDYIAWKEHLAGSPFPQPGNKHFWKSDIMTHHGESYYLSTKIISRRGYGTECLGGENLLGYNLPMGATNILTHGAEYKGIFPLWDWTKVPGTTSAQEENAPKMSDGYLIGSNNFGGGVSSATAGVIAYQHYYKGLDAYKAYFMFGDAMFCLGTNIRLSNGVEVATSVNQCLLNEDVTVSHGETTEKIESATSNNYTDLRWVHHDNVGYIFPEQANITVKNQRQQGKWSDINNAGSGSMVRKNVFSTWISHGTSPLNAGYQYIIAPGKSLGEFKEYAANHGFVVVRNDDKVQAVRNDLTKCIGIVFHVAETVDLSNGLTLTSDKPVLVLVEQQEANNKISVADPLYKENSVTLTLNKELDGPDAIVADGNTTITLSMPTGDNTGKSLTYTYADRNYSSIPGNSSDQLITVSPNPARSDVVVSFKEGEFIALQFYSLNGKLLLNRSITTNDNSIRLSVENYPAGIYLFKMIGENRVVNKKMIIH